jgi:hypothetical protein
MKNIVFLKPFQSVCLIQTSFFKILLQMSVIGLVLLVFSGQALAWIYYVQLQNCDGCNDSVPGKNGKILVAFSDYRKPNPSVPICPESESMCGFSTDSSGRALISMGNVNDTYSFEYYHNGPSGREFWGAQMKQISSVPTSWTFVRSMPYATGIMFTDADGKYSSTQPVFKSLDKITKPRVLVQIPAEYPYSNTPNIRVELTIQDPLGNFTTLVQNKSGKKGELISFEDFNPTSIVLNKPGEYNRKVKIITNYGYGTALTDSWALEAGPRVSPPGEVDINAVYVKGYNSTTVPEIPPGHHQIKTDLKNVSPVNVEGSVLFYYTCLDGTKDFCGSKLFNLSPNNSTSVLSNSFEFTSGSTNYRDCYVEAKLSYSGTVPAPKSSNVRVKQTNKPPDKATIKSPLSGATDVPLKPTLEWNAVDDPDNDDVLHKLYFEDANPPNRWIKTFNNSKSELQYTPIQDLSPNKTFYWRVDTYDGTNVTQGDTWSFSTEDIVNNEYTVQALSYSNGTVSPSSQRIPEGNVAVFDLFPSETYTPSLSYSSCAAGSFDDDNKKYTTGEISNDCELSFLFVKNTAKITLSQSNNQEEALWNKSEFDVTVFSLLDFDIHEENIFKIGPIEFSNIPLGTYKLGSPNGTSVLLKKKDLATEWIEMVYQLYRKNAVQIKWKGVDIGSLGLNLPKIRDANFRQYARNGRYKFTFDPIGKKDAGVKSRSTLHSRIDINEDIFPDANSGYAAEIGEVSNTDNIFIAGSVGATGKAWTLLTPDKSDAFSFVPDYSGNIRIRIKTTKDIVFTIDGKKQIIEGGEKGNYGEEHHIYLTTNANDDHFFSVAYPDWHPNQRYYEIFLEGASHFSYPDLVTVDAIYNTGGTVSPTAVETAKKNYVTFNVQPEINYEIDKDNVTGSCPPGTWTGNYYTIGKIENGCTINFEFFTNPSEVKEPSFSLPGGQYNSGQYVEISSTTSNAQIRYTIDGSDPTNNHGKLYDAPVLISKSTVLKAIAFKGGMADSTVISEEYTINIPLNVAKPNILPKGGNYTSPQDISIFSDTAGATIKYTLDGSTPGLSHGFVYDAPIRIDSNSIIKAMAYKKMMNDSDEARELYLLEIDSQVSKPFFDHFEGSYDNPIHVSIFSDTAEAKIYYTMDGSEPSSSNGIYYANPILIDSTKNLKAIAIKDGFVDSAIRSAVFSISLTSQVSDPAFVPEGGRYLSPCYVYLKSIDGASIKFTKDGTDPTSTHGEIYTAPIFVSSDTIIKAIAIKEGMESSSSK